MEFLSDEKIMTASVEMVLKDEVLFIKVMEGVELNEETSIVNALVLEKFLGNKKYPVLVDASANFTVKPPGLSYWASDRANKNRSAVAIMTSNDKIQVFTGFLQSMPLKHAVPLRIFSSKKEALQWLEEFKNSQGEKK